MHPNTLAKLIQTKKLEHLDLSDCPVNDLDFSGCKLRHVIFATSQQKDRVIKNVNFKNAVLHHVVFEHALLENCNFDCSEPLEKPSLEEVSFKNAQLNNCRFRNAWITWTDFRYAKIDQATFESAQIDFCDFYRAFLMGVVIFRSAQIAHSSLFYTYFGDAATIRRTNLEHGKIIQQQKKAYRQFLIDWKKHDLGPRKNDQKDAISDWNPDKSLNNRYADAEDIYKTLNGLWTSRGFMEDANWAYVQGRRMERSRMLAELLQPSPIGFKIQHSFKIFWNLLSDLMFGYGESILKMIATYIFIIFLFAYFYYAAPEISLSSYLKALEISLKNMVAISSDHVVNISPLVDVLHLLQTTLGILLTGIFGFILGNKIRSQ